MSKKGTLYMIPLPLVNNELGTILPDVIKTIHQLRHFAVENARTARRFISATQPPYRLEDVVVNEIPKHDVPSPPHLLAGILEGLDYGVMSEAGCPGVADPGATLANWAHNQGVRVVPMTGPSSILLALIASGMTGQHFTFHGYLPRKKGDLASALKRLESDSAKLNMTQIFIEAPYRNGQVFEIALTTLRPTTMFGLARDITGQDEWIKTASVADWQRNETPDLHKRPAVFLLNAASN